MIKDKIEEIIHNGELVNKKGDTNILLYRKDVVDKINELLEISHFPKRKGIDLVKEIIISNILLEDDIEKFYNNVLITHDEIIINLNELENTEKRSLGLSEIDMFYTLILDLLKTKFEEISNNIATNITKQAFSRQNPNEYIEKYFTKIAVLSFNEELDSELDHIDPSLIQGLSQRVLREYFNKILNIIAKNIIDAFGNGDKKAKNFLEFYGKKLVIQGKSIQTKSFYREISIGNSSDKTKVEMNNSYIFQTINTRKNTQIPSIEKSKKIIEGHEKSIREKQSEINKLKNAKRSKKIDLESFMEEREIYKLYVENQENDEKIRKIYKNDEESIRLKNELLSKSNSFYEIFSSLEQKDKMIVDRNLTHISNIRKSIERIELQIKAIERDIQTNEELMIRETEKLETTKEYDIERQYQDIINQLAKLLLKPY